MRTSLLVPALVAGLLAACGPSSPPPATPPAATPPVASYPAAPLYPGVDQATHDALVAALKSDVRPAAERARDRYRHPLATLEFFGIKSDMHVVELWSGGGWYTAILAPVLAAHGKLVSASPAPPPNEAQMGKAFHDRLAAHPEAFGKVELHPLHPPDDLSLGPDASADMVLTFRNFHNWERDGIAQKVVAAAFAVLKPGGVFGVVEHRAAPGTDPATAGKTGYVPQDFIVQMAKAAGFVLAASSEINANPKDTRDWPDGVWTLPPVLRRGQADRAKYLAIGESDRMTLKFVKPAAGAGK